MSAPGACVALSMAYWGTDNQTISSWLAPPSSLRQVELTRPDLFMFRAMGHGLVNWNSIDPSQDWIRSYFPIELWERLVQHSKPPLSTKPLSAMTEVSDLRSTLAPTMDLSSEDDVENRCPDQTGFGDDLFSLDFRGTPPVRSHISVNRSRTTRLTRSGNRRRSTTCRLDFRGVTDEAKIAQFGEDSLNKFVSHDLDSVDLEAIRLEIY